jgi:hypothetical protein
MFDRFKHPVDKSSFFMNTIPLTAKLADSLTRQWQEEKTRIKTVSYSQAGRSPATQKNSQGESEIHL